MALDPSHLSALSRLLDHALDLAPEGVEAWLAGLPAEEQRFAPALRKMLARHRAGEQASFMADGPQLADDPQNESHAGADGVVVNGVGTDEPETLAGQRLGVYSLVAPLGRGGTGSVWRARRDDGRFEGEAAIKLLHLSLLGRSGAQRFRREGAILARLTHPHIARLMDAGISDAGQPYLVLELVEGDRIDRYCDSQRLTIERRLALFADVLDAVAHAHSHLVIHRDVKPTNILVTQNGSVKLLDFGIAKLLEDETQAGEATEITREGGHPLTPEYAAPEQLRGEPVTTATDVYALGVLLYRLLCGGHPTSPAGATASQIMRATLDDEAKRLSAPWKANGDADTLAKIAAERSVSPSALGRQLRGDLENIVGRALRKVPSERYVTVDALAEDLRRYLAHEPVSARPDSLAYRSAKFVRRYRVPVALAALAGIAIVAGLIGTITEARRAERQAIRAELQARQAQRERDSALQDAAFADGAQNLISFLVNQVNVKPMTGAELLQRAEELTSSEFADDALTRGRLQMMLSTEYGESMQTERAVALLAKAQASARVAGDPSLLSQVDCALAVFAYRGNQPQRALALFSGALERLSGGINDGGSTRAGCLQLRAMMHRDLGQSQAMLDDDLTALAGIGTPRRDQLLLVNLLQVEVAEAYGRLGQMAKSIPTYERALADLKGMGRQQSVRMALILSNFSRILYQAGQTRRAQETAARGLAIAGGAAGNQLPDPSLEGNDARALVDLGRFDEAKALTDQALGKATHLKNARWTGTVALYGARAWCATDDLARCGSLLATARENLQATLPPGHPNLGVLDMDAAQLSLTQRNPALAREQLQRAISTFDAAKDKVPQRIRALALLARAERELRDLAAGSQHAAMAVAQAREVSKGFASTEWLGSALLAQAILQKAQGDVSAARSTLREALPQLRGALGDDAPATREALALLGES